MDMCVVIVLLALALGLAIVYPLNVRWECLSPITVLLATLLAVLLLLLL